MDTPDERERLILEAIYERYGYDFRCYSPPSIRRRLRRAASLIGTPTLSQLQDRLLRDEQVLFRILDLLTVTVTELFRDPQFFRVFRERVVPILATYPSLRIWHAGCSTGEEVFSLAILLDEEGLLDRTTIFGTDINRSALASARKGILPASVVQEGAANYAKAGGRESLSHYYTAAYGHARINRRIMERITFHEHNLATDSVFVEANVILCRNVLIYFNRELQNRAGRLFADSLIHRGFLCLGDKETVRFMDVSDIFEDFAPYERIYCCTHGNTIRGKRIGDG